MADLALHPVAPAGPSPPPAADPEPSSLDRILRLAAQVTGAPVAVLAGLDRGGARVWSADGDAEGASALAAAAVRALASSRCPLRVHDADAARDGALREALRRGGLRACLAVPLEDGAGTCGVLVVADRRPRAWEAAEGEMVAELAAVAAETLCTRRAADGGMSDHALRGVIDQSLAGIYVIQDGVFRFVNQRFCEIFGYPPEHFRTPRPFLDVVFPEDHALVAENIRRRLSGEVGAVRYALRGRRADGSIVHLEVHGSRADLGGRPAVVGLGIDVTARVRAQREREEVITARDRFYAMISHELRTPVSAVMLHNDLLLSGVHDELAPSQREAVEQAQRSATHLLDLINDLLDLSRMEAGRLEVRVEEVEVAELVEGLVAGTAPVAREHGCTVRTHVDARPLAVIGDGRRIRQILLNLLSNAYRFGAGRPVEIGCAAVPGGAEVQVRDHGPGIPAADAERVFEDFVQLGVPVSGTGLGLPIARRLAELQGGSLRVEPGPGGGSVFRLFLPAEAGAPPHPASP